MSWIKEAREYYAKNPIHLKEDVEENLNPDTTLVDSILQAGENGPVEPEDQFGNPKQLSTIAGLRKKGFDNARIFKAMELEEAEAESVKNNMPEIKGQGRDVSGPPRRDRGTFSKFAERFSRAKRNSKLDQLYYLSATGVPGAPPLEDVIEIIEEFEARVQSDPVEADNFIEDVILASGDLVGSMVLGFGEGGKGAVAGATGAAVAGATLAPMFAEEVFTVPAAAGVGFATGSTMFWAQQGAGMTMRNLVERGVDSDIAALTGTIAGIPYALLERLQVSKLIPQSLQNKLNNVVTSEISKSIPKLVNKYGTDYVTQIAQEDLQLITTTVAEELAVAMQDEDIPQKTIDDFLQELKETTVQTAKGLIPLQGGRAAVDIGVERYAKPQDIVAGLRETAKQVETQPLITKEESVTIESQAKQITEDEANDFNIVYDNEVDGSQELSADEILASGYDIDLNEIPISREDEYGNKFYAVKVKGETDSEGNIRLTSAADRSTVLEEAIEARLKKLQNSKNAEDQALIDKIKIWMGSVRKKASEMGLEIRFSDTGEGNIELFSDAILYTLGGFTGLDKKFEDAIYIPEDISNEFVAKFGEMSDGTSVFEMLKGSDKGIQANQEFSTAVDEDIASQLEQEAKKTRPPPAKPSTKSKLKKKTKQMVPGENTKSPEFKKWFGNSKVVDENNQPLVVYHGTVGDFDSFNTPAYFSDGKMASDFVMEEINSLGQQPIGENVKPVYLSIKNPKIYTTEQEYDDYVMSPSPTFDSNLKKLKNQGFDGIVYKPEDSGSTYYVAFEPTQIKSAFNQGTFDPNDANISYQLEPDVIKKAVGLYPPVTSTKAKADRLRLTVARKEKTPLVGRQNNNRVEFELENGGVMILGRDKTPEDWIRQVESILDQDEIQLAMNWYEDAYPAFVEEFGEADAVNYMVAWLLGNVQASPQQALSNTFLGMEQLRAELPSFKSAGTKSVSKNIKTALQGLQTEKGAGAKLYDFLDSALGKPTRTIMQDDERGLAPVAIDRHTFRDAGFVDAAIKNILGNLAIDKDRVKRLRFDSKSSSPTDTQYEYALKYMNELTDSLNEMGYMGGNLKPHQVQAIGWTAIARMSETSEGQSIPDALGLQKPTVAFALRFGDDSPYSGMYGEAFDMMPEKEKIALTDRVVQDIVPELAKDLGLKVISVKGKGYGIWDNDPAEPNATINVRGSNQSIKALMNSIGVLFQQSEVGLISKAPNLKGLGMIYSHKELANPEMQQAVYDILREETDNDFTPGASSVTYNGMPGLMVGTFVNQSDYEIHEPSLNVAVQRIRNELGIDLDLPGAITPIGSKYEATKNNWKKDNNGERYRKAIRKTHPSSLLRRLDNYYGPKIERQLQDTFAKESDKRRKTRQLVPDPDYAAELQAGQEDISFDLNNTNTWLGFIREKLYDKLDSVVSWQRDIEEQRLGGNRLRDHMNVSLAAELFVGKVPEMLRDFNKKIIDSGNKDSFISRLVEAGISTEDFNMYLHAMHAQERNDKIGEDGASGMTKQQARTIKAQLNKKYGLKNLKGFVKEFRTDIIDASLQMRLDNGLIDQETFDRLKGTYKNYVPLYRVMDDKEEVIEYSKKKVNQFDVKGPEFFKARGSERKVKNILVSSIEQYHEAVIRSEKNKVNMRMLDLINAFPNESFEVVGVPHRPVYDENGEIKYMVPIDASLEDSAIHVKVDGKVKRILFKGEQGLKIARAMKDLGTTKGVKYVYAFNNYLRYVNTIANPEFMVTNFVRDIQTAGINISAEQGNAITLQALNPRSLKSAWKSVFNVVQNDDIDSEWGRLYERLRKAGGKTGFFDYETIEDKVNQVEKDLKRVNSTGRGIKVAGKSIFTFVENLNEATESAVRLTLFKAMLDNGYSEEQAASGAKNVTINFNQKGQWGQYLNSVYLFANAGFQGTGRILGVIANSKKAQAAVATLAALGVTESFYNQMANDDEEYDKLPNWEKDNNFILRYGDGDKFFKMRLPYGYNVFKVVGNIAGDIAWRQMQNQPVEYDKQLLRFLEAANSAFNPIGGGDILQTISPTASDWLVQLSSNKSFHGGPIAPETVYGPAKADVEQAWERTPGVYKDMAQWIFKYGNGTIRYNSEGGIDSAVRGPGNFGAVTDISPETIEYFVDYLGGGLGKTVARTINTARGVVKHDADYTKSPFVRTFFGKFDKKSEIRSLYMYEKEMSRTVFDGPTRLKYLRYLESFYKKGNLTRKEYRQRYKKFVKAQREAVRNID